jgi:hypothetical protein
MAFACRHRLRSPRKFVLWQFQLLDAGSHVFNVLIKKRVHLAAIVVWPVPESEQVANFFQGHVKETAVPDELKTFDVSFCIQPVVCFGSSWLSQ